MYSLILFMIFIGIILLFIILNLLYKNTNHYKNTIEQVKKYIEGVPQDLEIVNTGSSYAKYAFDYSKVELKGFNFALQPQSLMYDYKILQQYKNKLKKECIILIALPNLVFGFLDYDNENSNTKYYYFLNSNLILKFSKIKKIIKKNFPLLINLKLIFRIIKDVSLIDYNLKNNQMNEKEVTHDATLRINNWIKQFNLKNTIEDKIPSELEIMFEKTTYLLNEIIEYCLKNNFKPVIVVPPCSKIINNLLSEKFLKKVLYDNIKKSNKKNIPVLDYLCDERFQDYKLYINSDMLNKTGSEKFTKIVIEDLKKIKILK